MCLMISGLLRGIEKFASQSAWNNPDTHLDHPPRPGQLDLQRFHAGVRGLQIVQGVLAYGGVGHRIYHGMPWIPAFRGCGHGAWRYRVYCGWRSSSSGAALEESVRRQRIQNWRPIERLEYHSGSSKSAHAGDVSVPGIRGCIRHPRNCGFANVFGRFLHGRFAGIPLNVFLQYIVPVLAIPFLIAFKYGKPRRYLFDFVEWHTKPRIYCGMERDSQQTVMYLKEDQPECL